MTPVLVTVLVTVPATLAVALGARWIFFKLIGGFTL